MVARLWALPPDPRPASSRARQGAGKFWRSGIFNSPEPFEILIQRSAGREPVSARFPVGAPQSRLPHRLLSTARRAKTDLSAT
ncbi:MAG TPA: hypothetical protein PL157_10510 [Acidobacteriota bacterium]|nr:hypothetical protein [Acidobacteriota bacterium]